MAITSQSFIEIWQILISKLDHNKLIEASVIAKQIWFKNQFVHQSIFTHPNVGLALAIKEHSLYKESCKLPSHVPPNYESCLLVNKHKKWSRHPPGHFELIWDTTLDKNNCKAGIGAII